MISWLLEQSIFFSLIILLLITTRRHLRVIVGAKGFYFLWAIIPIQLLLSIVIGGEDIPVYIHSNFYVISVSDAIQTADNLFSEMVILLTQAWLIGGGLCALGMCLQHYRFISKLKLSGLIVDDPCIAEMADNFKNPIVTIQFKQGEGIHSPVVTGLINATIILPTNYAEIEKCQKRLMIEHELVHAYRGDLLWNLIALTIICLFWFNPFAWWAYGHFRHAQEMACDVQVLANKNNKFRLLYANALLENSLKSEQYLLSTLCWTKPLSRRKKH